MRRSDLIVRVLGLVLGVLAGMTVIPRTPVPNQIYGDKAFGEHLMQFRPAWSSSLVASVIDSGTIRIAGIGPASEPSPLDRHFELGSITKTFSGMLLVDSASRGELSWQNPVGKYLEPLRGYPSGSVSLEELATHRAGLPRILPTEAM